MRSVPMKHGLRGNDLIGRPLDRVEVSELAADATAHPPPIGDGAQVTRRLVMVPGRALNPGDAAALRREWLEALTHGLSQSGLHLPVPANEVCFPDYVDGNRGLPSHPPAERVTELLREESLADDGLASFLEHVLEAVVDHFGVTDEQTDEEAENAAREGERLSSSTTNRLLGWEHVIGRLRAMDGVMPEARGTTIGLSIRDFYWYLHDPQLRSEMNDAVAAAMPRDAEIVVVAHSLGALVAYDCLRSVGAERGWSVPLLVTLGAPLGLREVRRRLQPPVEHPRCVHRWLNAFDSRDVIAIHPLGGPHFRDPRIENYAEVANVTENRHQADGYLRDPQVARRIHDALVGD